MLNKSYARDALQRAVSTGGDFAELFYEDTRSSRLSQTDDKIDTAITSRIHGVGLRVYQGLRSVYVHSSNTDYSGLMKLADAAAGAIGSVRNAASDIHLVGSVVPNVHRIEQLPMDVPGEKRAALIRGICRAIKSESSEIAHAMSSLWDWEQHVTIANTEGMFTNDVRVYSRVSATAVASKDGVNQTGSASPGGMIGFELYETQVDPEAIAKEAAQQALTMLHADFCPAGVMPVVIDGGFGGVIFHEACGHSLEATGVAYGNSEFCGKLGQQIASTKVTAIDDGTIPNSWGSENIDDEGTPTTKLVLIEKGILKNYMIDRFNSRRMNMPVTGSGRRQDYTFAPTSRMRNTYIAPGDDDENDIISSMGNGLYAKKMGGGSVNPITGEFNFAVGEGYLVKDGKIDRPVRGATLIGKGGQTIMKIDMVGKKMWMAQGMCGSQSGSVPTNVGQPMIRVTEMTVGGRK
ncbi:MAG: TldD/PmbA family protein [Clostridiales bacterium]|nr:TldD/PmbA family protein [Clostridiales bacterium]